VSRDWADWLSLVVQAMATAGAVAAVVFAWLAAKANRAAVSEMRRDRRAEYAGLQIAELRDLYHGLADLEKMPLTGDLGGFNRTIEGTRRYLRLSGLSLPATDAVVNEWISGKDDADPRPLVQKALSEIEALIDRLLVEAGAGSMPDES
jgi:hypothetical protein